MSSAEERANKMHEGGGTHCTCHASVCDLAREAIALLRRGLTLADTQFDYRQRDFNVAQENLLRDIRALLDGEGK